MAILTCLPLVVIVLRKEERRRGGSIRRLPFLAPVIVDAVTMFTLVKKLVGIVLSCRKIMENVERDITLVPMILIGFILRSVRSYNL